mmetsp:Transcript_51510/g.130155  ORF Transcript_51510/g.130155 Transcript_51510/m.130155 type:complete len:204 (-) Transcript_51510:298-909(-)
MIASDEGPQEGATLPGCHDHVEFTIRFHGDVQLIDAPRSSDVPRRPPGIHQRQNVADGAHAAAELLSKRIEGNSVAAANRLLNTMLVHAEATDPDIRPPHVQIATLAIFHQGINDVTERISPGIAQHEVCAAGIVSSPKDVYKSRTFSPIPWATIMGGPLPDDARIDVVDRTFPREASSLHLLQKLRAQVMHRRCAQWVPRLP